MRDDLRKVLSGDQLWTVICGDALGELSAMPSDCIDAVVTDPPAGISMMGRSWDHNRGGRDKWIAWLSAILAECYRVTKPGGRMLCWSIPRTMHWTGMAIEDAGWFVENTIAHINGSGFPKAKSQLKPAREDWWLCRKPSKGVPPLNIDACLVPFASKEDEAESKLKNQHADFGSDAVRNVHAYGDGGTERPNYNPPGRWPANVVLSHSVTCKAATPEQGKDCAADCPVAELDRQSIEGGMHSAGYENGVTYPLGGKHARIGDSGGASRFFHTFEVDPDDIATAEFIYAAKASRSDRDDGCGDLPQQEPRWRQNGLVKDRTWIDRKDGKGAVEVDAKLQPRSNNHPTVKSTKLMQHFVRLVKPPVTDGTKPIVLDPFAGSGSTGRGAVLEGCRFIGIELSDTEDEPYVSIARRRIAAAAAKVSAPTPATPQPATPPKQGGLFDD